MNLDGPITTHTVQLMQNCPYAYCITADQAAHAFGLIALVIVAVFVILMLDAFQ